MRFGIEVEGRFKGLRTIFVQARQLDGWSDDSFTRNEVIEALSLNNAHQLYIDGVTTLSEDVLFGLEVFHAMGYVVTIETHELQQNFPDWVNVMLHLKDASFFKLKPHDQVKFVNEDRLVYCVTKENMTITTPDQFDGDIDLSVGKPEESRVEIPGIAIAKAENHQQLKEAISSMDLVTQDLFDKAARGECAWICPDCCVSFPEGMPDECPHKHQGCTDIIKNDKDRAIQGRI
jgi:hypothetical protein